MMEWLNTDCVFQRSVFCLVNEKSYPPDKFISVRSECIRHNSCQEAYGHVFYHYGECYKT